MGRSLTPPSTSSLRKEEKEKVQEGCSGDLQPWTRGSWQSAMTVIHMQSWHSMIHYLALRWPQIWGRLPAVFPWPMALVLHQFQDTNTFNLLPFLYKHWNATFKHGVESISIGLIFKYRFYCHMRTKYEGKYCFQRCLSVHTCGGGGRYPITGQDGE